MNAQGPIGVRKKVAFIIPGGIGTGNHNIGVPVLQDLVKLLAVDVDITVFSLFKVNGDFRPQGFILKSIPNKNIFIKCVKLLWYFWHHHRLQQFDVVHGFWALPSGFLAAIIGRTFNIKCVVSVLGGDAASLPSIRYGQLRNTFQRTLVLWTLRHADECTALTQFSIDNLIRVGLKKSIKVIPWGVDTARFFMKEKPVTSPVQFLHIANLTPVKDQSTLLHAFQLISLHVPSMLTIIGEGSAEREVRSLVFSLGLQERIKFLDAQPYEDLPFWYHNADILLHTSLSEGQSEVVTEAMSCGVLVCGTRVGLMADIPEACLVVDVGDFRTLADEVIKLLDSEPRINELRRKAFEWATTHSIKWTTERTKELYDT